MYAIIRTGNRQYRADVGSLIDVERLPNAVNDTIEIKDVLLVGDGAQTVIGQPNVDGAVVKATIVEQYRAKKVLVFKYKQRTPQHKMRGHRQYYTRLRIDDISI